MGRFPLVVVYGESKWGGNFGGELEKPHFVGVDFDEEQGAERRDYVCLGLEVLGGLCRDH